MMGTLGTLQISRQRGHDAGGAASHAGTGGVTGAIQLASAKTGVDFDYLVKQAEVESSMNPNARAKSSSATGLYQFIEQTWLKMVKSHGAEHGYGKYADAIKQTSDGDYVVKNRGMKSAILNLRRDPKASALMAAELAQENHAYLKDSVGGKVSDTDLYMAHFMGAQGASNFLSSMRKNPWAPAASLFPEAAKANRGVFYQNGRPLSLQQVYNRFDAKFDGAGNEPVIQTASADSDTYVRKVTLPQAADWSNPFQRTSGFIPVPSAGGSGLMAFAGGTDATSSRGIDSGRGRIGGFLSSPTDVMMLAQANALRPESDTGNDRFNS